MTMLLGRFIIIRLGGVLPVAAGIWRSSSSST